MTLFYGIHQNYVITNYFKALLYVIINSNNLGGERKPISLGLCKSLSLDTYLFVKVPRPGDSEVTFSVFESSCHPLLPD